MEKLKQMSVMMGFLVCFQDEARSAVLKAVKAMNRGSGQTRNERAAVVEACE